jgi:hypothetical protein
VQKVPLVNRPVANGVFFKTLLPQVSKVDVGRQVRLARILEGVAVQSGTGEVNIIVLLLKVSKLGSFAWAVL